jgi:hypothetical protein
MERFVNDLMVRGEASELTPGGKLPLDATHVIEKQNDAPQPCGEYATNYCRAAAGISFAIAS